MKTIGISLLMVMLFSGAASASSTSFDFKPYIANWIDLHDRYVDFLKKPNPNFYSSKTEAEAFLYVVGLSKELMYDLNYTISALRLADELHLDSSNKRQIGVAFRMLFDVQKKSFKEKSSLMMKMMNSDVSDEFRDHCLKVVAFYEEAYELNYDVEPAFSLFVHRIR